MKTIVANWKMSLGPKEEFLLAQRICALNAGGNEVVLCPSFLSLRQVSDITQGTHVKLGAQNCAAAEKGSYTGEVSAYALKEIGCEYVILGHSERRILHNESSIQVQQKAQIAHKSGLKTIICIGETSEQRTNHQTLDALKTQLQESLPDSSVALNTLIAYEPVWAIGAGRIPSVVEIEQVSLLIQEFAKSLKVLYGGSVTAVNSSELNNIKRISGLLVGGASLDCDQFAKILKNTQE